MESIDRKRVGPLILSILVAALATFLLLSFLSVSPTVAIGPAQVGPASCLDKSTLEDLVVCIYGYMPRSYTDDGRPGFVTPTLTEMSQWREVVSRMMQSECPINLSEYDDWSDDFIVTTFPDDEDNNTYCVFMETKYETYTTTITRVTHGWGTFIVNPYPCRELSIQIAHPIHDIDTATQGIGVFKGTNSRSFLMAGTHRHANNITSTCQYTYTQADVAHNVENMFQPTVQELLNSYDDTEANFVAIQFHGMGVSSCLGVDVYMTHGISTTPTAGDKILELKSNLKIRHNGTWTVTVPGDSPYCGLHGSSNVQGRLLNNVTATEVCTTPTSSHSGRFIHIEQKKERDGISFRDADNWIDAINDTWPGCLYLPLVMRDFLATGFEYDVQGCLSSTTTIDDPVEIYVEGNDVVMYHSHAIYNCCAIIVVDLIDESPLLKLIERETYPGGYPCTCRCPYNISARIPNLPSGNYRVEVWNWDQSHRYGWAEVVVP